MIALIILAIVFLLIATRQFGNVRLQIWQIMLGGAVAALLLGQITPLAALQSINLDVMIFLFAMFLLGNALEKSGYLHQLAFSIFRRAQSTDALILFILFGFGFLSAILMNDTLAIIGTPIVLYFATKHKISPKLLLLSLCFAVTIGSIMSPIGNPQNLLIALHLSTPFATFLRYLFVPTVLSLLLTYVVLRLMFKREFRKEPIIHKRQEIRDQRLALLCKMSLLLLLTLIAAKIIFGFRITYISLAAAPILLSRRRTELVKGVDWSTLTFFAAMFILMAAVWLEAGYLATYASNNTLVILLTSVLASQVISNVPFVALFLPALGHSISNLMALAAGSTLAGNLFILGAASNVIIIQQAERRGATLTFWEFAKAGVPVTILSIMTFWILFTCV